VHGIIGGIYEIGGGAIVAPFFVAIIGLPVYTVAGAALMGSFINSAKKHHPMWEANKVENKKLKR